MKWTTSGGSWVNAILDPLQHLAFVTFGEFTTKLNTELRNDLASDADFGNGGSFRLSYCLILMSLFSALYSSTALPALETECLEAGDPLVGLVFPPPPPPPLPLFEDAMMTNQVVMVDSMELHDLTGSWTLMVVELDSVPYQLEPLKSKS